MAIRGGHISALGTNSAIRKLAGPKTRTIDLGGRTVIPGLIDSHLHAIRAALSFSTEVNWIGARTLAEALSRIHEASQSMKPGAWLIVAGGWNVQQFRERRRPTQEELTAAAPANPVYVQLGYGWVMMTPAALRTPNWPSWSRTGRQPGWSRSGTRTVSDLWFSDFGRTRHLISLRALHHAR
jgi:predicted amidohydrolase YtcJ